MYMAVRKDIAVYLMQLTTYLKQLTAVNRGKDNSGNEPGSQTFQMAKQ